MSSVLQKEEQSLRLEGEGVPALDDRSLRPWDRLEQSRDQLLSEITLATEAADGEIGQARSNRLRVAGELLSGLERHGEDFFRLRDARFDLEHSTDTETRIDAVLSLKRSGGKLAARLLVEHGLKDSDAQVRSMAANALSLHPYKFATYALAKIGLNDSDLQVIEEAAKAIEAHPQELQESIKGTSHYQVYEARGVVLEAFEAITKDRASRRERFNQQPKLLRDIRRVLRLGDPPRGGILISELEDVLPESVDQATLKRCLESLKLTEQIVSVFRFKRSIGAEQTLMGFLLASDPESSRQRDFGWT